MERRGLGGGGGVVALRRYPHQDQPLILVESNRYQIKGPLTLSIEICLIFKAKVMLACHFIYF